MAGDPGLRAPQPPNPGTHKAAGPEGGWLARHPETRCRVRLHLATPSLVTRAPTEGETGHALSVPGFGVKDNAGV